MSLICLTTIAAGLLISKGILFFNLAGPMIRYGTSVLFSYGVFFVLIYFWLRLHFGSHGKTSKESVVDPLDAVDFADVPCETNHQALWTGQGGQFSGGGASSSWASDNARVSLSTNESTDLKKIDGVADFDEGIVIILLITVFAAIFGSAGYLIYHAPEILLEAAFEVVLAAGLLQRAKKLQSDGWHSSIFKQTWWLFAIVLCVSVAFGFFITNQCPEALSFAQYRELCWNQSAK